MTFIDVTFHRMTIALNLKQNWNTYYNLLQEVRNHGTWEVWLEFFLEGVLVTSQQGVKVAENINKLFDKDLEKIRTLGKARISCESIFEHLKHLPQVTAPYLAKTLGVSPPTARTALNHMVDLGVLEEISGKQRDKIYLYKSYLEMLEDGME